MIRVMEKLYDCRSRYVHRGEAVGIVNLDLIKPVSMQVLYCLLRLQASEENLREGFLSDWLRSIDFLVATAQAGRAADEVEYKRAGIPTI